MSVTTYDPEKVYLKLGEAIMTGWNTISITRDSFPVLAVKGIRGKHTRTISYDSSATIRLTLPAGSEWNNILSSIINADIRSGSARCDVQIKDTNGSALFHSTEAFVTNFADVVFDNTLSERTWIIQCLTTTDYGVGSTTSPVGDLLNSISNSITNLF